MQCSDVSGAIWLIRIKFHLHVKKQLNFCDLQSTLMNCEVSTPGELVREGEQTSNNTGTKLLFITNSDYSMKSFSGLVGCGPWVEGSLMFCRRLHLAFSKVRSLSLMFWAQLPSHLQPSAKCQGTFNSWTTAHEPREILDWIIKPAVKA